MFIIDLYLNDTLVETFKRKTINDAKDKCRMWCERNQARRGYISDDRVKHLYIGTAIGYTYQDLT